jgi:iron-sulfur cluster insertion protein
MKFLTMQAQENRWKLMEFSGTYLVIFLIESLKVSYLEEVAMSDIQFNNQLTDQINVSPEAVKQLLALTENEEGVNGVRIFVSGGGCGGMSYGMTFVDQPNEYDCMLEKDGLKVYVDAVALSYLEGVEIDYQTQGANASFVFKNVFANTGGSGACGACGAAGGGCG